MLALSFIEVALLTWTSTSYHSLVNEPVHSSDQFQGFGIFLELFVIPLFFLLSSLISLLFAILEAMGSRGVSRASERLSLPVRRKFP